MKQQRVVFSGAFIVRDGESMWSWVCCNLRTQHKYGIYGLWIMEIGTNTQNLKIIQSKIKSVFYLWY